jgi:8-oxoguanine deaminase
MFRLDQLGYAGALHDPLAALVFCTPSSVACSIIHGRVVVRDGRLTTIGLEPLVERHNRLAMELVATASAP